jgi:hypothetical protein
MALLLLAAPLDAAEHNVRLRVIANNPQAALNAGALKGVEIVQGEAAADLVWLAEDGSLLTGEGEVAAQKVDADHLQSVADKWNAVEAIGELAGGNPLAITVSPPAPHHKIGSTLAIASEPLTWPYFAVFNLSSGGEVQFLYPREGDPATGKPGAAYETGLRVSPPTGADHLVIVTAEHPLDALIASLKTAKARDVEGILRGALAGQSFRVGIVPLFASEGD